MAKIILLIFVTLFLILVNHIDDEYLKGESKIDNVTFSIYPMEEYLNQTLKNVIFEDYNTTTSKFHDTNKLNKFDDIGIDINSIKNKINEQNKFFEYNTNTLKEILDKLTDIMENESLLSYDRISELIQYLGTNRNFLASNIKL